MIRNADVSAAIFAPAWTYECGGMQSEAAFALRESRYATTVARFGVLHQRWAGRISHGATRFWTGWALLGNLLPPAGARWVSEGAGDGWEEQKDGSPVPGDVYVLSDS